MVYVIGPSPSRFALALLIMAVGSSALASAVHAHLGGVWAALAGCVFLVLSALVWRSQARLQPCALRLMGGSRAILYYLPPRRLVSPRLALGKGNASVRTWVKTRRIDTIAYADYDAVPVYINHVVHWPGVLIQLSMHANLAPRIGTAADFSTRVAFPKHCLLFADTMTGEQFRSLGRHLRCVQRGVTLVEHRP